MFGDVRKYSISARDFRLIQELILLLLFQLTGIAGAAKNIEAS